MNFVTFCTRLVQISPRLVTSGLCSVQSGREDRSMSTFGDVTVFRRSGTEAFDGGGTSLDVIALNAGEIDLQSLRFRSGAAVIVPAMTKWSVAPSADATLARCAEFTTRTA